MQMIRMNCRMRRRRHREAWEVRKQGLTFQAIRKRLGLATRDQARTICAKGRRWELLEAVPVSVSGGEREEVSQEEPRQVRVKFVCSRCERKGVAQVDSGLTFSIWPCPGCGHQ